MNVEYQGLYVSHHHLTIVSPGSQGAEGLMGQPVPSDNLIVQMRSSEGVHLVAQSQAVMSHTALSAQSDPMFVSAGSGVIEEQGTEGIQVRTVGSLHGHSASHVSRIAVLHKAQVLISKYVFLSVPFYFHSPEF